jgi:phage baseplate assembly protein W
MAKRAFAAEDEFLNTFNVATSRSKEYRDIDLTFSAIPVSGDIYKKSNRNAVKQAIKTLLLTNLLEKPFLPEFGGNLQAQLFELADDETDAFLRENIIQQIKLFEPRAQILDLRINLSPDANALTVTLEFKIVNTEEIVEFTTKVSRLR